MSLGNRVRTSSLVAGVALLIATCGGSKGNPTATAVVPSPPAATPAPTPTPDPVPYGISAVCYRIGLGDPKGSCGMEAPSFLSDVDRAIEDVVARHPEIFDLQDQLGGGGYRVKSMGQFYVSLLQSLQNQSLCAVFDGEEVAIKNSQSFHDQYKVVNSSGHLRRGKSEYRATCTPAGMPILQGAPPPVAGCELSPSRSLACGREERHYEADVEQAIKDLQQSEPQIFDGERVLNPDAYNRGVVANLNKKGYCGIVGDEIGVKKTNDSSEVYDILLSEGKIRHGGYRVTCYPADF